MPHSIELIDGSILTPFGIRDLLEAVRDYAGDELAQEIESYVSENVEDIDEYEQEFDRMEKESEQTTNHYRAVLCNIQSELDDLGDLLRDTRLNRSRMKETVKSIQFMIDRELLRKHGI